MIFFHSCFTVRSIIIINIIVIVVVVVIYYCYRIIVISCPHYLCVVRLVSITQQKKTVDTVGCTLWLALSKQIQILLFCDNNIILKPAAPHLSILKLLFSFILGLNFIFFCFKLNIIHYHTQKPTYLGSNQPWLLILETLYF